jgi:hypothetical protein
VECPYCGEELEYHDYYGRTKYSEHYWIHPHSWIERIGDIFKCKNEDCECFEQLFYTDERDDLHEGYPC